MSDVTTIEADVPERYADAVSARLRSGRRRGRRRAAVAQGRHAVGARGHARGHEPARLAGHRRALARAAGRPTTAFATSCGPRATRDAVVLGMGGSSLAPEVFRQSFGTHERGLRLHVLDSTHPDEVRKFLDSLDLDRALMIVSSKSGGTIEPMSMFKAFFARQGDGTHFVAVTDPGTSLEELAGKHGFRRVFHGDPDIGGRYSALSAFGLVPAAAAGLRRRRRSSTPRSAPPRSAAASTATPGLWLGCALGELALQGRDKLTFVADAPLSSLRHLGRAARRRVHRQAGPRHPADRRRAAARPEAYGDDRVFLHIALDDAENASRLAALKDAGHPVITIRALGPDRPRPDLLPVASSRSPSRAGCWRSTRSTSPTSKRPRTTPTGCSKRVPRASKRAA